MIKKIQSILFHALLLVVYTVFFSIQFFYNSGGRSSDPGNGRASATGNERSSTTGNGRAGAAGNERTSTTGNTRFSTVGLASSSATGPAIGEGKPSPLNSSIPAPRTIRLNKHFHQADIFPCTVFFIEAPVWHFIPRKLFYYPGPFTPAVSVADRLLRGPPFAA
jgi:hypothetical protein